MVMEFVSTLHPQTLKYIKQCRNGGIKNENL